MQTVNANSGNNKPSRSCNTPARPTIRSIGRAKAERSAAFARPIERMIGRSGVLQDLFDLLFPLFAFTCRLCHKNVVHLSVQQHAIEDF